MKDTIVDPNFPRTLDGRVYHLGLRPGEVANRILTLGSPARAHTIAAHLDPHPAPFTLTSERGFTTHTGRFRGVPVSVIAIGMGAPNADFFVREVRECVEGEMLVVRLGSCGALVDVPVGAVVVPRGSVAVRRNYDYDFGGAEREGEGEGEKGEEPYWLSKPVLADTELHDAVVKALHATRPAGLTAPVLDDTLNASADSFYSSQGRQTSFPDHNAHLIARLRAAHPDLATFEMETFHILHLAASWAAPAPVPAEAEDARAPTTTQTPTQPTTTTTQTTTTTTKLTLPRAPRIRAAAAQMVFAARSSAAPAFIAPAEVAAAEAWAGRAVLEALVGVEVEPGMLHEEAGSVWEIREE